MAKRTFKCATDKEADTAQVGPPTTKPIGSRDRAIQRLARLKRLYESAATSIKRWEEALQEAKAERSWEPLKYKSLDDMLKVEIGATEIESRLNVAARAKTAPPLAEHGEIGRGRENRDDIINSNGGTSADYLTRRIARDAPEILERMKAGEFSSVRQAAIEAGIVKVKTPLQIAMAAYLKLEQRDRVAFVNWMKDQP